MIVRACHCSHIHLRLTIHAGSHPLLRQTPLTVNPFLSLPKPPTLPPSYVSLPSSLPPTALNAPPSASGPAESPAYVTTSSGFAAHPSAIITQNRTLLQNLETSQRDAEAKVRAWEEGIKDRELAEKRRRAPGWLDSEQHLLQPEKGKGVEKGTKAEVNLMDEATVEQGQEEVRINALGNEMDRVFGRTEMG